MANLSTIDKIVIGVALVVLLVGIGISARYFSESLKVTEEARVEIIKKLNSPLLLDLDDYLGRITDINNAINLCNVDISTGLMIEASRYCKEYDRLISESRETLTLTLVTEWLSDDSKRHQVSLLLGKMESISANQRLLFSQLQSPHDK